MKTRPLLDELLIKNVKAALAEAPHDPKVGIRIAQLGRTGQTGIYAATIDKGKKVGAHCHPRGQEIYLIMQGRGIMHCGLVVKHKKQIATDWLKSRVVKRGDCFTVERGYAHQLANTGNKELILIFVCPEDHLTDKNRVMLADHPWPR
jgi:mannose-6-phosphate isomerase-like protein (cupin superfamily)